MSFSLTPDLAFRNGFRDDMDYQDKGKMSRDADGLADLKKEQDRLLKNLIRQVKVKSVSRVSLFVTPWALQSMEFSRPEYRSG